MSARRDSAGNGGSPRGRSNKNSTGRAALAAAAVVAAALLAACESAPLEEGGAQHSAPDSSVVAPRQAAEADKKKPAARAKRDAEAPAAAAPAPEPVVAKPREPQPEPVGEAAAPAPEAVAGAPSIRFKSSEREPLDDEVEEPRKEIDRGTASWYGLQFHGRQTANGERYNMYELTAAHKTLPFGTIVRVRSLQSGRSVDVRINDRGPYVQGRVIDLSKAAAEELGMAEQGLKPVSLTVTEWPDDAKEAAQPASKPDNKSNTQKRRASPRRKR